jgi:hypothetical protein
MQKQLDEYDFGATDYQLAKILRCIVMTSRFSH